MGCMYGSFSYSNSPLEFCIPLRFCEYLMNLLELVSKFINQKKNETFPGELCVNLEKKADSSQHADEVDQRRQ
ncbi:hypothetical protein V202x_45850 [Gimesia aquarii]|uniref:Uncharacterized protein n=1 Tax=Gimesia aquarii TaxID=2527964 RepID=A0A517X0Z5_9PLAN|nr:hypothetical protein V202x_45850 [Gimesia aquarii]